MDEKIFMNNFDIVNNEVKSEYYDYQKVVRCKNCKYRPAMSDKFEFLAVPKVNGIYNRTCLFVDTEVLYDNAIPDDGYCWKGECK